MPDLPNKYLRKTNYIPYYNKTIKCEKECNTIASNDDTELETQSKNNKEKNMKKNQTTLFDLLDEEATSNDTQ